jgi:hypothetical protein
MNRLIVSVTVVFILFQIIAAIHLPAENKYSISSTEAENYCGKYHNKRSNNLFASHLHFELKCDSTFTYSFNSCLVNRICNGTWSIHKDSIILQADKKTLHLVHKYYKKDINPRYSDLTGTRLVKKDSILLWFGPYPKTDTLYK